jgi:hypothetical protein
MMNDRFDAQLREHLLGTADTSPADGQLARVVGAVNHTAQRRPLLARLAWNPGRIGPVPTRALQVGLIVVALGAALVAGAIYAGGRTARTTPFEGWWASTDPGDGSVQTLVIGSGATPPIQFVDRHATGLACRDDAVKTFFADGTGAVQGNALTATFPDGGGCGLRIVEVGPMTLTYESSTDTIVDQDGLTWSRADEMDIAPTAGPVSQATTGPTAVPTPELAPSATPGGNCIQFEAPDTYAAPAPFHGAPGSIALEATVGANGDHWLGLRERFTLAEATCGLGHGSGRIEAAQIDTINADGCAGEGVPVASAAAAAERLATNGNLVVHGNREVNLNGSIGTAIRVDGTVQGLPTACQDGELVVNDDLSGFAPELDFTIYFIDDDGGNVIAVALYETNTWNSTLRGQVDDILGSLELRAAVGISG